MSSNYTYGERCPVCDRDIKRRPAQWAGWPCPYCINERVTPRDKYRLKHARLTDGARADIIDRARATGATEGTGT